MPEVTLELVQAKQTELAALIQRLQAAAAVTTLILPAVEIALHADEHYAGVVLDDEGRVVHHVVLMAQRPDERLGWKAAMAWAKEVGGELPTRQEQALLFANCKQHLEADWYWSSEVYAADSAYAWCCHFGDGDQYYYRQVSDGCAVAVRRVNP